MAKLFLDANIVIDILEERRNFRFDKLSSHSLYSSPLSLHIYSYVYKKNAPISIPTKFLSSVYMVPFDGTCAHLSLEGPTKDLEDNVQLHSAVFCEADYFITNDKKLLNMKIFRTMRIATLANI